MSSTELTFSDSKIVQKYIVNSANIDFFPPLI